MIEIVLCVIQSVNVIEFYSTCTVILFLLDHDAFIIFQVDCEQSCF